MQAKLGEGFNYPLKALKKHFIALGSSGSGKTVLSKVLIEEAAMNGISSILVDPQGDLASLGIPGDAKEIARNKGDTASISRMNNVRVVIFTPTSSKGIPICINPLKLPDAGIEHEDLVSILNQITNSICQLLGYNLDNDRGKTAQAVLYTILRYCSKKYIKLNTFDELAALVTNMPDEVRRGAAAFIKNDRALEELAKKIKFLTVGEKELLFQFGVPLDIDTLLGNGKTQISIIYLNTLSSIREKQFFVSMLATELYQWMLHNPSEQLQALFYIDEIADYIPAGALKPITKPILRLLFKQARKYGIGCAISTQNPGDIDYKAFAQFGTWAIGRLTTKQDTLKIASALRSLAKGNVERHLEKLPQLQPGEFLFFCPDAFKKIEHLKVRWLLTKHKTLTENDVKVLMKDIREDYRHLEIGKQKFTEELSDSPKKMKLGKSHFAINITHEEITNIIEKKKKKGFLGFGEVESIESCTLILRPVIKAKVRINTKTLFKSKIEEHELYFDGLYGDLMHFKGNRIGYYEGYSSLVGLTEREISIIKTLIENKKPMTNADIAFKLQLTDSFVSKSMNQLMDKKLVSYIGKTSRAYLWQPLIELKLPKLKHATGKILPLDNKKVDGKLIEPEIAIDDLAKTLRAWYSAALIEADTIYYPIYKVKLFSEKSKRELNISAIDARVL